MAKKRKASRSRKAARAKTARRKTARRRGKSEETDPMHIIAALLVAALIGLGIYLYQLSHQPEGAATSGTPPAAQVEKK
jgi:hypothetical protein